MKEVNHIEVPKEWKSTNDWDSHRPLLYLAVTKTPFNVMEFGSGDGSTKLLSGYCNLKGKSFYSFETNEKWAKKTGSYFITDYLENIEPQMAALDLGLMFIDSAPGETRKDIILAFSNKAEVILVHDTEESAEYVYGMKEVLSTFKYRLDYKPKGNPHTSCVSNFIDVESWV